MSAMHNDGAYSKEQPVGTALSAENLLKVGDSSGFITRPVKTAKMPRANDIALPEPKPEC
jgi:hypothetical protein